MQVSAPGNSMRSSMMGCFSSHSVSPVMTSLRPATAMMSPVLATLMSSRLLACIMSRRPIRSFLPLFAHSAYVPASRTPLGINRKVTQLV